MAQQTRHSEGELHEWGQSTANPRRWTQVNCVCGSPKALVLCVPDGLGELLEYWSDAGVVVECAYLYKRPGIRVRVVLREGVEPASIADGFDSLRVRSVITSWSWGCYEPEVFLWGGECGTDIAHAFFTCESLAVAAYERLMRRSEPQQGQRLQFSLLLLDRLLRLAVEDENEIWDVWCKMVLTGRIDRNEIALTTRTRDVAACRAARERLAGVRAREASRGPLALVLQEYENRVSDIARRLRAAHEAAHLLYGMRHVLPFWIVFHWNRMRFDRATQKRLITAMLRVYGPC